MIKITMTDTVTINRSITYDNNGNDNNQHP